MTEGERRVDLDTRERVEEIRAELLRSVRITLVGVIVLGAACVIAISLTLRLNSERVDELRDARVESVLIDCAESNARNRAARAALALLYAQSGDRRLSKEARERSRRATEGLIDKIVPSRDCAEVAAARVP